MTLPRFLSALMLVFSFACSAHAACDPDDPLCKGGHRGDAKHNIDPGPALIPADDGDASTPFNQSARTCAQRTYLPSEPARTASSFSIQRRPQLIDRN
jgi:hypothetical protein